MVLEIAENAPVENFTIENNILKGVDESISVDHNIGKHILEALNSKPSHVAQIDADTEQKTTLAEMKDRSVRCGLWLRKQGVGSGDIVTICSHNHLDTYAPIFATYYVGATCNSWFHLLTLKPACHLMSLLKPKVIFSCESVTSVLEEAARIEKVDTKIIVFGKHSSLRSFDEILREQSTEEISNFQVTEVKDPKETAVILLTSGSTGFPKGVMHSYENFAKMIKSSTVRTMKDVALWYATSYWISGYAFIFINCLSYGTRIIHANFDPDKTCEVIERFKVERVTFTPTNITYLIKSKALERYKLESLKIVAVGGAKLNVKIFEEFKRSLPHTLVSQAYGITEVGRGVAMQTNNCKSINSVGFVNSRTKVKIINNLTNQILGANQTGEICVKSITGMLGYYKNPEVTKQAVDQEGWFYTNDIGYYDENGEIFIVDRKKEVMKYQNHQVSPTEIEEVLLEHPGVMEVAVVPAPHKVDGEHAVAFVKRNPSVNVTEEELVELSLTLGEVKKLWGGVQFLDQLPKLATGKVNKLVLKYKANELALELAAADKED